MVYHFSGDLTLTHVTMSDNRLNPGYTGAGRAISKSVSDPSDGALNLLNSIVTGSGPNCVGGLDQISGNLSPDGSCAYEPGGAPRLGALTGSPAYLPLLDNSSAVDRADPDFCLDTDQIGTARPQGGGCDVGAIESTTAAPAPTATPTICTLQDQIIAANTDRAYGSCPAGNGADIIYMVRDYALSEPLAPIKTDITIEGNGHTINGGNRFLIFNVDGGRLTINNATLTRGSGAIKLANGGRAIANDVSFIANGSHGAISSRQAAYIEVNNSSFIRNTSGYDGGAIGMNGGGVANIKNSSFVGNSAAIDGGAIRTMSGWLYVSNSSFIGNRASRRGGAVSVDGAGAASNAPVARLTHVTMLDNRAGNGQAIWIAQKTRNGGITARLRNSILASIASRGRKLCSGRLTQNLHNLIEDGSCSPMFSGDPMFEEADESGAMVAPSAGSPAIDAGHPEVCPDTDQIGTARPLGNGCDLGAIEVMPVVETLTDCRVTPTHNLNFRDGPWGNIIGAASNTTTFTAIARTPGWFAVEDEAEGRSGWISTDYVVMQGDCG